jgi:hypothetical protein
VSSYKASNARMRDLTERKVEGEAAREEYPCEESRESAGEPDGKADEEPVAEPTKERCQQRPAEPRTSFLHGTSAESRSRPSVPLRPVGSSLASILSESRAYEFRLGQRANGGLAHARSEGHLCEAERLAGGRSPRNSAPESGARLRHPDAPAPSCDKEDHQVSETRGRPGAAIDKPVSFLIWAEFF